MIHIGKLIREKMIEQKCTVVSMAKQLSCGRANVYKIFDIRYLRNIPLIQSC